MKKLLLIIFFLSFCCGKSAAATNYCSDSNMKGAWKMNEASGAVEDCTTNNNDGTNVSCTQNSTGKYDAGIDCNEVNNNRIDFDSAASLDDLGTFSIGGWIAPDDAGNGNIGIILMKYPNIIRIYDTNKLLFYTRWTDHGACSWRTTSDVVSSWDGSYHHVVVVYDGGAKTNTPTIYFDGSSVALTVVDSCNGTAQESDAGFDLYAGWNSVGGDEEFDGDFDEMFWYDGLMTSGQVTEIMNNGLDGTEGATTTIRRIIIVN